MARRDRRPKPHTKGRRIVLVVCPACRDDGDYCGACNGMGYSERKASRMVHHAELVHNERFRKELRKHMQRHPDDRPF